MKYAIIQKKIKEKNTKMMKITTPEDWLKNKWRKISNISKTAFFSAIIIGLMTHLYQFTNKLYNYDELAITPAGYGIGAEAGRWFLKLFGDYTARNFGNYSLPLLNGLMSVVLLALSAAFVVDIFKIKSKISAMLIGGLMVAFTPVVCMFFFMYAAPFYSLAIFFSVLAAYLVIRYTRNIWTHILAMILIMCSLGTYQAYFSNTVCILMMQLIVECAFTGKEKNIKSIILDGIRYLLVLIISLVGYLVLHKCFVAYWGVQMVNYQGLDSIGEITVAELVDAVKRCYMDIKNLCVGHVMYLAPTHLFRRAFCVMYAIFGISVVTLFIWKKREWGKKFLTLFGLLIFPIALFLVYLMSPKGWAYTLMGYSVVFLPILVVIWIEKLALTISVNEVIMKCIQWITALVGVCMVLLYVWYGNGCYMSLDYTKYHDLAYYETMVTQIKSLDGYTDELPVAFVGNEISDQTNNMGSMLGGTFGLDGKIESNINAYSKTSIMTKYLGFAPQFCGYDETANLMKLEEVKDMSCYPDSGSIKIINGTVVIKLGEY